MNANFEELEVLINSLKIKPDVLVCTETWKIFSINRYKLDGYKMYHSGGTVTAADGVMVYVKQELTQIIKTVNIIELSVLRIELFDKQNKKIIITAIYRLHSVKLNKFLNAFEKYLLDNKNCSKQIIIGDINVDIAKTSDEAIEYCTLLAKFEFISSINSITRPNENGGTCIDHIFIKGITNYNSYNIHTMVADHFLTCIIINNCNLNSEKPLSCPKLNYKKVKHQCSITDWKKIVGINQVDLAMEELIKCIDRIRVEATSKKETKKKSTTKRLDY